MTRSWDNRWLVDVAGPASVVESMFAIHLMHYVDGQGHTFYAPDSEPSVPADIAACLQGIVGLDSAAQEQAQIHVGKPFVFTSKASAPGGGDGGGGSGGSGSGGSTGSSTTPQASTTIVTSSGSGLSPRLSGVLSGTLSPHDIKTAYNLNSVPSTGANQVIGLIELNGFNPSDIQAYEDAYQLPHIPIQIVSVDGATNTVDNSRVNNDPSEVAFDIELVAAMAPGARLIRVYEAPYGSNVSKSLLDLYNYMCADDTNQQGSTSAILPEAALPASYKQSENTAFESGTLAGSTYFAASGDWGPYPGLTSSGTLDKSYITAGEPAAQPFVCGVGGTTLTTDQYANYVSETTWSQTVYPATGPVTLLSGGGSSNYWAIMPWQKTIIIAGSGASLTYRNVPDVAINAYINYSIYYGGRWGAGGGTSAGAPLWAGFMALVNGRLNSHQAAPTGWLNYTLYSLAQSPRYHSDFHDINDNSSNGKYNAVAGYDLTTGLGSMNGANLFADIAAANGG